MKTTRAASREEAIAVIEQLRTGNDFVTLAQEHASGPTGPNGGDLGWFTAESMTQPIAEAVRGMEPRTFSDMPVETEFGHHVLLLEDTRTVDPPSIDSLREELTSAVERTKLEALVKSMRDVANVENR
jgi:peptidyl-prolyl cis-trans isomerase C